MQLALSPFQLAGCAPKWDIELSGPVTVGTMPWKEGHGPTPARQSCGSWPGAEGAQRVPGAGRWARQEGGEGRGSGPPLSLLAPGKILKHAKFNSHISFFTSFASEIPSLWDSHWSCGPYLSPHGHRELLSLSMPLSPFSSRERSLGSGELGGRNE